MATCEAIGPCTMVCSSTVCSSMTGLPSAPRTDSPLSSFFSTEILYGFDELGFRVRLEILNHSLRHEKHREDQADGQQQDQTEKQHGERVLFPIVLFVGA